MLIEHITMIAESVFTRHEIRPDLYTVKLPEGMAARINARMVDRLTLRERRKLDRAYRIAARKRDKKRLGQ